MKTARQLLVPAFLFAVVCIASGSAKGIEQLPAKGSVLLRAGLSIQTPPEPGWSYRDYGAKPSYGRGPSDLCLIYPAKPVYKAFFIELLFREKGPKVKQEDAEKKIEGFFRSNEFSEIQRTIIEFEASHTEVNGCPVIAFTMRDKITAVGNDGDERRISGFYWDHPRVADSAVIAYYIDWYSERVHISPRVELEEKALRYIKATVAANSQKTEANQALLPTATAVTPAASHPSRQP